jgi:predicted DCC family thiol-disulfide oxidoreductase YuxK
MPQVMPPTERPDDVDSVPSSSPRRRAVPRWPAGPVALLDRVVLASALRPIDDARGEQRKLNLVRVYVGLIVFVRTFRIATSSGAYFPHDTTFLGIATSHHAIEAWTMTGLAAMLMLGVLTPVVGAALLFFYPLFDTHVGTHTLGTLVLCYLLAFFLLSNAGAWYSVDGWLLRRARPRPIAGALRGLYGLVGFGDARRMRVLLFLLFLAYSLSTFSAILIHVQDPFWQNGAAVGVMLVSSAFSRAWEPARWMQEHLGGLSHVQNVLTDRLQMFWEMFMIPLVFFRWGERFVALWGMVFIGISLLVVQLSYLPFLEAGLWAIVFVRPQAKRLIAILYDDRCNLCRRTVAVLRVLNARKAYTFEPLSRSGELVAAHGLTDEEVQENLHGVYGDRVYAGYALYELIARRNPLLWPVYPFLVVGRVLHVGPALYRAVARNRRRLFGTCEVAPPHVPSGYVNPIGVRGVAPTLIGLWAASMVVFVLFVPQIRSGLTKMGLPYHRLPDPWATLTRLGFEPPNVFNTGDLLSGNTWAVLHRAGPARPGTLVPYNGEDGQRLEYFKNDLIYYGTSIPWRLIAVNADVTVTPRPGEPSYDLLWHVAQYDKVRNGFDGPQRYTVDVYRNAATNYTIDDEKARFERHRVNRFTVRVP